MKKTAMLMSLFTLCMVVFGTHAWAEKVKLNQLVDQFNNVVFIHEHGKTGREAKPLVKWGGPVRIALSGTFTKAQITKIEQTFTQIRKLTKLDIRPAKKGEKPNLFVVFKKQKELVKELPKGINCMGNIGGKASVITRARILIPSDRPDKTTHCIVEELVQVFGLANDSVLIKKSIFHEKSKMTKMSISDQILLKALYDKRLKVGMRKEEARILVRQAILDILQNAKKKKK